MFFENYNTLCKAIGETPTSVGRELGVPPTTVSRWRTRGSMPHYDIVIKIGEYFHVDPTLLINGSVEDVLAAHDSYNKKKNTTDDPELLEYLEKIANDPDFRMLFSVTKDASAEDVRRAVAIIKALRETERKESQDR